jgi:SAM-dependent methyltransferase
MGRFLEVAAGAGAEVIGMDLSRSVERARRETRHADHVHFVQGDILRPPFRPGVFGVVYSLGVLHHTPGTRAAFAALCPLLREGGRISIWVYPTFAQQIPVAFYKRIFARLAQGISDGTRLITTRLPRPLLHYLCYLAVPVGWLKRLAAENRGLKYLLWPALLAPVSAHREWRVRLCDTFDWLAPPYQWKHTTQEVLEWFREAGLEEVRPLETPVSATGCKGARKSKPAAACQTVDTSVYAR